MIIDWQAVGVAVATLSALVGGFYKLNQRHDESIEHMQATQAQAKREIQRAIGELHNCVDRTEKKLTGEITTLRHDLQVRDIEAEKRFAACALDVNLRQTDVRVADISKQVAVLEATSARKSL